MVLLYGGQVDGFIIACHLSYYINMDNVLCCVRLIMMLMQLIDGFIGCRSSLWFYMSIDTHV